MNNIVERLRKMFKTQPPTRKQVMDVEQEMDDWMATFGGRRLRIIPRRPRKRRRKLMRDGDIQDVASVKVIK